MLPTIQLLCDEAQQQLVNLLSTLSRSNLAKGNSLIDQEQRAVELGVIRHVIGLQ